MTKLKPPDELRFEKERIKMEEEKVENVFKNKSRVPDSQNRMKSGEPARGE